MEEWLLTWVRDRTFAAGENIFPGSGLHLYIKLAPLSLYTWAVRSQHFFKNSLLESCYGWALAMSFKMDRRNAARSGLDGECLQDDHRQEYMDGYINIDCGG
jgi:hypothetical protein